MVQHRFSRPELLAEWNAWYEGNLKVLLSVPGIHTGQRFRTVGDAPDYMAMYTLDSADVLESEAYRAAGGGGTNSQHFRPAYQIWIRNLFEGISPAPGVASDQYLVMLDSPVADNAGLTLPLAWMKSVGLHRSTPCRGLVVVDGAQLDQARKLGPGVEVFRPITAQQQALWTRARTA